MLHDLYSEETKDRIKSFGRPTVGRLCSYVPSELIDAAGAVPIHIQGLRGPLSLADSIMHTNICPYIKACMEAFETGALDFLDAAVFTSGCDAQRRMYDVMKERKPDLPVFLLNIPKKTGPAAVERFAGEFRSMKSWLESVFKTEVTEDKLAESIKIYRYLRARARGLDGARRKPSAQISGSKIMEIMLSIQRMPPQDGINLIHDVEEEIKFVRFKPDIKVLLVGNMADDPSICEMVERNGGHVFADNVCSGRKFWLMPEPDPTVGPVECLAKMYLEKSPCPRMAIEDDYVLDMRKLIDNLKPDGVIFHTLKFCDTHSYDIPRLRDLLAELNVRGLFLEMDYAGPTGQTETRVQAFLETLGKTSGE